MLIEVCNLGIGSASPKKDISITQKLTQKLAHPDVITEEGEGEGEEEESRA